MPTPAAGTPIEADAGEHGLLWLDRRLFGLRPDYLLRVRGDSMLDDGILVWCPANSLKYFRV